ncbi:MAG: hypothetical protein WCP22_13570 [Chlamydiota bacterium]
MWLGPGSVTFFIAVIVAIFLTILALILDEACVQKCLKCRKRLFKRRESGYCPGCEEIVKRGRHTRYYENT